MKKNLALTAIVLLLLFAVLESTFLFWFPRVFPTGFVMMACDEGLQPLLQSSKKHVIPQHYIALLGDSYAQGMGDWATGEMGKPMARYGTAHLLQDATGRDVVTFGSAGAGSVRGIVTEPVTQLAYLRQYIDSDFPQPELVLVYFYEGNDLNDNAAYFHYSFPRLFDIRQQFDETTYQRYLQEFAIERDETWRMAQRNDVIRHLPFLVFMDRFSRTLFNLPQREEPVDPARDASLDPPWIFGGSAYKEPGKTNLALVSGKSFQLPDLLQGPALNLDDEEWRQSWFAFEQSLRFSRRFFAGSKFVLVYIPSILSTYTLASEHVVVQSYERRETVFSSARLQEKSLQMRREFSEIAARNNLSVIDTTDALQAAARKDILHGPGDWNHLNRKGYEVLSAAIAGQLLPIIAE